MLKPEMYSVNNISGTINILNAACAAGIKRVVFSSSAATYGEPKYLPSTRTIRLSRELLRLHQARDRTLLGWYDKLKGLRFAALRYFNAAGYDVRAASRAWSATGEPAP
jgi:UDP-glucose 4-epimerase